MSTVRSIRNSFLAGLALAAAWLPAAVVSSPAHAHSQSRVAVETAHRPAHAAAVPCTADGG